MIPFDFVYCRANTLAEAREAFMQLQSEGKEPVYYAGGSEIITMSRAGSIRPGAVIDIKRIPECTLLSKEHDGLRIGSACTLNRIKEAKLFPLLGLACGRIADHTNQCRITLGGNLCGAILYRETSLPLLLSDATVTLLGNEGLRIVSFAHVFQGRMHLSAGELVVGIHVPEWALQAPHFHIKQTANEKIDYPLVSMAAIRRDGNLRLAFSGICSYPFRSPQMEAVLNDRQRSVSARATEAAKLMPEPACDDVRGSGGYRSFVLKNMLRALLEDIANGQI
ncbi:MAG TPA: FAD binding domain-containing protein [Clostridia bacterium]|nr:FAD binding domain-containing protein [Clostridia bacterium]